MVENRFGRDLINDGEVSELISVWGRVVERRSRHQLFSMFYVASFDSERGLDLVRVVAEELGIAPNDVIETTVEPGQRDVVRNLMALADEVSSKKGHRVMMIVMGFESLVAGKQETDLIRLGHDYDQEVRELSDITPWGMRYQGLGKHVVIVTMIGGGLGAEVYNKAVKSAVASRFKNGIIEIR